MKSFLHWHWCLAHAITPSLPSLTLHACTRSLIIVLFLPRLYNLTHSLLTTPLHSYPLLSTLIHSYPPLSPPLPLLLPPHPLHTQVRLILEASVRMVEVMDIEEASTLVHCSDGWDRTAQLAATAQLLMDPFYRTCRGFGILVEKEWCAMGHQFQKRCGHTEQNEGQGDRSPIFLQVHTTPLPPRSVSCSLPFSVTTSPSPSRCGSFPPTAALLLSTPTLTIPITITGSTSSY